MKSFIFLIFSAVVLLFVSCRQQQWDEHGKTTIEGADLDLLNAIMQQPEASKFYEILLKTGYDELLTSGGNFTIMAPDNAALNDVNMDDMVNLKKFAGNHIAYGKRITSDGMLYSELNMISGKVVRYDETGSFNGAQLKSPDHLAGNGVFHIIDRKMEFGSSIWEYISGLNYKQTDFLKSCEHNVIDMLRSRPVGQHPQTGATVYDTVWMAVNAFLEEVPLHDETKLFTYVVLQDEGFDALTNKFKPYFKRRNEKETDSLTRFVISKDMIFDGIADITANDTLTSLFGVKVALTGNVVSGPYVATNGHVYVLNRSNIRFREKIKEVIIDAVNYTDMNTIEARHAFSLSRPWSRSGQFLVFRYHYFQRSVIPGPDGEPLKCVGFDADSTNLFEWWCSLTVGDRNSSGTREINNFDPRTRKDHAYFEYKANLNSGPYEIRYLAYDDYISAAGRGSVYLHGDDVNKLPAGVNPTFHLYQKFFISMPDAPRLKHGNGTSRPPDRTTRPVDVQAVESQTEVWSVNAIENNFLGPDTCFVAVDTLGAGIEPVERRMNKWRLKFADDWIPEIPPYEVFPRTRLPQLVQNPVPEPNAYVLQVPRTGEITMWLTNTARRDFHPEHNNQGTSSATANRTGSNRAELWRGYIIMDYIRLVPVLPDED